MGRRNRTLTYSSTVPQRSVYCTSILHARVRPLSAGGSRVLHVRRPLSARSRVSLQLKRSRIVPSIAQASIIDQPSAHLHLRPTRSILHDPPPHPIPPHRRTHIVLSPFTSDSLPNPSAFYCLPAYRYPAASPQPLLLLTHYITCSLLPSPYFLLPPLSLLPTHYAAYVIAYRHFAYIHIRAYTSKGAHTTKR